MFYLKHIISFQPISYEDYLQKWTLQSPWNLHHGHNQNYLYNRHAWHQEKVMAIRRGFVFVGFFFSSSSGTLRSLTIKRYGQGRSQTFWFGGATGGASFATRGAVNGLCLIALNNFNAVAWRHAENFWGARQNFWGGSGPPWHPLAPPLVMAICAWQE